MSHLLGSQPKIIPEFTGLQVSTSVQVLPITIIYGGPRVSINMIYYNGFNVQTVKSSGGGKGLLTGGKGGSEQVEYFATFIAAIGEGPIGSPLVIYQDQEVWTPETYPSNGTEYFNGSAAQTPWSYILDNWNGDARSYKLTAYYAFANAQIDASATVPQINVVVQGLFYGSSPLNYSTISITSGEYDSNGNPISYIGDITLGCIDADPAQVIYDFLTDSTHGVGFPAEWIDTSTLFTNPNGYDSTTGDNSVSSFCQSTGLAWSVAIDNVESGASILERWCKNLNVAVVWNGALLKFLPRWDTFSGGNPGWYSGAGIPMKYYTPYTQPITVVTIDQILQSEGKGEDPITFARKDPTEVYNTVRLDFRDRTNFFNDVPAEAKDEAHIELYGPRIDNIGLATEFTLATYANVSAQIQLRRNISIVRTFTWKMGPLWGWLDPMDIITIPDPVNYSNTVLVRLVSVEDDENENVTITAEEYPIGNQSPAILPLSPTTPPNQGAANSPPAMVYPPLIFAPTTAMLTATGYSTPQVIIGASAGNNGVLDHLYGGAFIWVSLDNVSYSLEGSITGPSIVGSLTQPLPGYGGSNPDNTDTLYVNLSECDGSLPSVTAQAAAGGSSLCVVQDVSGFELICYTTATLVGPYTYALTGLYRGFYGTTPRFFGAGSQFMALSNGAPFLEVNAPSAYVGVTVWVKLQGYNVFNRAVQELSDLTAYEYIVTGPTPPAPVSPPMARATTRRLIGSISASTIGENRKRKGRLG